MFDISWTEFLLIGIVALVVIGPKELPAVMRTMGQWTRKVRSMAADFQNQFQEAMREAEMADLKKQVDDMAHDIKSYDPLKDVRSDVESIGQDIGQGLGHSPGSTPEQAAPLPAPETAPQVEAAAAPQAIAPPTEATAAPAETPPSHAGADPAPAPAGSEAEAAPAAGTGHTG